MFLLTELQDLEHATRPKSRATSTSYVNALWTNGMSWIGSTKSRRRVAKRLRACVVAGGGQFEHKTNISHYDILSCVIFEG